jgi:DNA helicase IV
MPDYASEIAYEQKTVDKVYARLDDMREQAKQRLKAVRARGSHGSPTQRTERDSFATMYEDRLETLRSVEDRLVFGRLDTDGHERRYVGRLGISDEEHNPILTDWRAQAAQPFYEATAKNRLGIVMRRHITSQFRNVVALEDEVLDMDAPQVSQAWENNTLTGEGALLTSLNSRRSGQMTDIVATIQAEQDRIIRSDFSRVCVVQGGPGTGKTAVALHRAAFLLYTYRKVLQSRGVLIVGPSDSFLHYIDQVLPSLGETGVLSRTISEMLPGISTDLVDPPRVARLKGDARMAQAVANAVHMRERVPSDLPTVRIGTVNLPITREDVEDALTSARRSRRPHNAARVTFVERMMELLKIRYRESVDYEPDEAEMDRVSNELYMDDRIRKTLNLAWLPLKPEWLIHNMLSNPARLRQYAPWLSDSEIDELIVGKETPFTRSDIPLLDEAMELIGNDIEGGQRAKKTQASKDRAFAQETLESIGVDSSLVNIDDLVATMNGEDSYESIAARAANDRSWTFGHVVVDEAQELTAMEWRMLLRRCPSRSFTIVGDIAQTSSLGGTRTWEQTLDPLFGEGAWDLRELSVDYRNPQEVADLAGKFASDEGLYVSTIRTVRNVPDSLERVVVGTDEEVIAQTAAKTVDMANSYISQDGLGRVAVICDGELLDDVSHAIWDEIGKALGAEELSRLQSQTAFDSQVCITTPEDVKGLEFDAVILVQPALIEQNAVSRSVAASDIYVAMTRPTQKLVIVRSEDDVRRSQAL